MKQFLFKFLDEIKTQSPQVRLIMFALCVVITVSLTGVIWFDSFEERLYFGLNLDPEDREQFLAGRNKGNEESMLADIGKFYTNFKSMTADIFSLFTLTQDETTGSASQPHKFPISGDK